MNEFVLLCPLAGEGIWGCETADEIDHIASGCGTGPNIAIYDPHYISLCFSIAPTHVPNLRVRPKVVDMSIAA